jgi:serine/threonine protein kinase
VNAHAGGLAPDDSGTYDVESAAGTMSEARDQKFIDLCVAKGLAEQKTLQMAWQSAQRDGRPVSEVLVESGVLPAPTVSALQRELDQELTGTAIAGFRIVRKLGQGGMGTVYLAEQTSLRRQVALKVVAPQFAADAQAVDRFMREARTAAAVNHPNIISVIDVGYDNGQLYMALELVTGGDAAQLAERLGGVLPEARALEIIRDCCQGLQALYEARLIHRDIKPANIFITKEGVAKLADLGLARSEHGDDRLTASGHMIGTPAFMSPEQASGNSGLDIRSDLYALGASLFALTTGSPPFTGNGVFAIAAKLLTEPAPDARVLNPRLSDATARVIARCLAKSPAERYQSPHDLMVAVSAALAGITVTTGRPPQSAPMTSAGRKVAPATLPTVPTRKPRTSPARRAGGGIPWLAVAVAIAVAAIAGIAWTVARPSPATTTPTLAQSATSPQSAGKAVPVDTVKPVAPSSSVAPPPATTTVTVPPAIAVAPVVTAAPSTSGPVIPGLIAHWPLDEGSGSQVRDLTGISTPGTIVNATWITGRIGSALKFSPPSKVLLGNAPRLAQATEITVMFWIKAPRNTVTNEPVSVVRHDRHFTALQLTHEGTAHGVSWAGDHVNLAVFPWRDVWDDERWRHYAVTYHQDRGMHIYRDGAVHFSDPKLYGPLPTTTDEPFILGASEMECEYFTGALDDVRVYDRVLTPTQIAAIVAAVK